MMPANDYNSVSELYDIYASTDYDFAFFTNLLVRPGLKVIELTSGTGRLSLPLLRAGADLTCVDLSKNMLDILSQKLHAEQLSARVFCSDIADIDFESEFDLAIFPFQSFMEILGRDRQLTVLRRIFSSLKPGGRFYCTLHNPAVRSQMVDGTARIAGSFEHKGGTLVVSGFEQGGRPIVHRTQLVEFYNENSVLEWKRIQPICFELIGREHFEKMAKQTGFLVDSLWGDYKGQPFNAEESPVMIWELSRPC